MLGTGRVGGLVQDLGPALQIFLVDHVQAVEHARVANLPVHGVVVAVMRDDDIGLQIPAKKSCR